MTLSFNITDELDLADEIPSALNNLSTLVLALPYLKKYAGINDDVIINASQLLCNAIDDVAEAVQDYANKKISEKEQK
jgi:hypothetical protein